jgi:hypothetical protein
MATNRSKTNKEELSNELLAKIVIAAGGSIVSNSKNALVNSWRIAVGG